MEQGPSSQPNLASFDRLTGKAVFFPTGSVGGLDLGNIEIHALELGAQRLKERYPIRRGVLLETERVVCAAPVYSIEGRQYHSAVLPLLILGTRNADLVQNVLYDQSITIVAQVGKTFDLGIPGMSAVTVKVGTSVKIADRDYFLEANKGLIRFPESPFGDGIQDGDSVTVLYDQGRLLFESYNALSQLDQDGTLKLWEMDRDPRVKNIWTIPGNMSAERFGDGDPTKYRKWKLRFAVSDQVTLLRRKDFALFHYTP